MSLEPVHGMYFCQLKKDDMILVSEGNPRPYLELVTKDAEEIDADTRTWEIELSGGIRRIQARYDLSIPTVRQGTNRA